jgi:hypothetical protein
VPSCVPIARRSRASGWLMHVIGDGRRGKS